MVIYCDVARERSRNNELFEPVDINASDPIRRGSGGERASISELIGVPLVLYRHIREPSFEREKAGPPNAPLDNQAATYLMIGEDGWAPEAWQEQVGTVTVMRKDGKPLTKASIETIWKYHCHLINKFTIHPILAQQQMNPADFIRFCRSYKDEQLRDGREDFRDMDIPL